MNFSCLCDGEWHCSETLAVTSVSNGHLTRERTAAVLLCVANLRHYNSKHPENTVIFCFFLTFFVEAPTSLLAARHQSFPLLYVVPNIWRCYHESFTTAPLLVLKTGEGHWIFHRFLENLSPRSVYLKPLEAPKIFTSPKTETNLDLPTSCGYCPMIIHRLYEFSRGLCPWMRRYGFWNKRVRKIHDWAVLPPNNLTPNLAIH